MIELVPTKHVQNREFSDSAQFHSLIGSQGLRLLVSGVNSRECVLVGTPTGAALRCFYLQRGADQMTTQDFLDAHDLERKITITLTVRDVLEIMLAARRPEGVALLAVNRGLGCLILMIGLEVMAAAERAAVWRYVEQMVAGRGQPVS